MNKSIEVLRVENLTKYYKCHRDNIISSIKVWVSKRHDVGIENISFSLYKGEIVGITGKEHCGKSTLLKLVTGIIAPTSGQIFYRESSYTNEQLRKISSYISISDIKLDTNLSFLENIVRYFDIYEDRGKLIDKIEELLIDFDIKEYEFSELKKLPAEAIEIIPIFMGFLSTKPIICIDQPFKFLNKKYKENYLNELKKLAYSGRSIVITSNSYDELSNICNRIIKI